MRQVCTVEGCGKVVKGFGYCNMHYLRFKRTGSSEGGSGSHMSPEERFAHYVNKQADGGCWEWMGTSYPNGYGRMFLGGRGGKFVSAHRYSCEQHHGPAPFADAHVMHKCDNRICVNPDHFAWCAASENIQDAYNKGRKVSPFKLGANHHRAKLNEEKALFVKSNLEASSSYLARLLGCSRTAIDAIKQGRTWKHVKEKEEPNGNTND